MTDAVLTLNSGSSSVKFSLFEISGQDLDCVFEGEIDGIGVEPRLAVRARGKVADERIWKGGEGLRHEDLLGGLLDWCDGHLGGDRLAGVGHRIVHGGPDFSGPVRIDARVMERLEALAPLAPLHQPHNLAAVRAVAARRPKVLQVACFDTAFHRGHAPTVDRFGLPRRWEALGVRRYGFHGLSYEFITWRMRVLAPDLAAGRMIIAHLGNGASLCAVTGGRSVDTTMGFTALDGLVMGTRCGALDPGVILHLEQAHGLSPEEVQDMLYRRSGLLGVSEISSDMRALLASKDPRAQEAVELFVFRVVREIGALAASMGGLDGLVFTAGIGERSAEVRRRVCDRLEWLGAALDEDANGRGGGRISPEGAALSIWALATDEDRMIARHTRELIVAAP